MTKSQIIKSESHKKASEKAIKEESRDSAAEEKRSAKKSSSKAQPKKSKKTDATPKEAATEEQLKWVPVRHPKMPSTLVPHYFVNKNGDVSSLTPTGKHRLLHQVKKLKTPNYKLSCGQDKACHFKLEEIMVYTFSTQKYDKDTHYIFHVDGNQQNCAWDNLMLCDLRSLQLCEIERLRKADPQKEYKVVRNLHPTLTFEHYLVSDAGEVFWLVKRQNIRPFKNQGYQTVTLRCDFDTGDEVHKKVSIDVDSIVALSFGIPIDDLKVGHDQKTGDTTPRMWKELPPITKETRWRSVGTLPWNGMSFEQYQVSDMGHVRKIGESKLLPQMHHHGYILVDLHLDKKEPKDDESTAKSVKMITVPVPRLVANAFVGGYSKEHNTVKHINEDKQDNRAQNLKWVSNLDTLTRDSNQVIVSLVEHPNMQKEFESKKKASIDLSCDIIRYIKSGDSIQSTVTWDGKQQLASIKVL